MSLDRYFSGRGLELLQLDRGVTVPLHFGNACAEHLATRSAAGLYDFSFMGLYEVSGPDARRYLEHVQTRNLAQPAQGKLQYTLLLCEDGSVFNDATLWCHAPDRYWLFTGRRSDFAWLLHHRQDEAVQLTDCSGEYAVLALQGPHSAEVLRHHLKRPLHELPYFSFMQTDVAGFPAWIGRLGYSGELGYEIIVPAVAGVPVWQKLLAAGAEAALRECGFEAANSLRVESGYILFSSELVLAPDPFELGLSRLLNGNDFIGAAALRGKRWKNPQRKLGGIIPLSRVRSARTELPSAQVTSEIYAPTLARTLALGFIEAEGVAPGSLIRLTDARLAHSARLPFYDPGRLLPRLPAV